MERESPEQYTQRRHERLERFAIHAGKIATGSVTVLLLAYTGTYSGLTVDGLIEQHRVANTHPSVVDVTQTLDPKYTHSATLVTAGYNNLKAESLAKQAEHQMHGLGRVLALNFDNTGIDYDRILEVVKAKVKEDGITSLSFYGDSIGGTINLNIAQRMVTGNYGISDVPAFTFDSTPYNPTYLKAGYAKAGAIQTWLHEKFPVQTAGKGFEEIEQMAVRHDQYDNIGQLHRITSIIPAIIETNGSVRQAINAPDAVSSTLQYSAYSKFASTNAADLIQSIGDYEDKNDIAKTTWNYIGGTHDTVVKTAQSSKAFSKAIQKAKLPPLHIIMEPGIVHGETWRTKELYTRVYTGLVSHVISAIYQQEFLLHKKLAVGPTGRARDEIITQPIRSDDIPTLSEALQ